MVPACETIMTPRIAVLVPCYNEETAIGQVVRDFRAALPSAVIYVYDNNSQDGTQARAREAGIVSEVFPAAELDGAVEAFIAQIMKAPRPARVGCKDYARTALDMDVTGAVDYARSIHAVINSSSEMLPAGHK